MYTLLNKKGMTLIEILISVSIFVIISIMASDFLIRGFKSNTFNDEQTTAIANARKSLDVMTKSVRETRTSNKGDYSINSINPQSFTFFCDNNNDGSVEKIKYYLASSTLKQQVTLPGILNDYTGTSTVTNIADYINNQTEPIFKYFTDENLETNIINNVRLINIKLKVNVDPKKAPEDYYVETDIQLRNLKDNL